MHTIVRAFCDVFADCSLWNATPFDFVRFEWPAKWTRALFKRLPAARAVNRNVVRRPFTAVRGLADSLILGRVRFPPVPPLLPPLFPPLLPL